MAGKVVSMESVPEWHKQAKELLPASLSSYVDLVLSEKVEYCHSIFRGVGYKDVPDYDYELVFIDGPGTSAPSDQTRSFDFDYINVVKKSAKPVYGILFGFLSGIIQTLVMNLIEKKVARESRIFNTYSFTLFGIQGVLGCIFAAAWKAVAGGFSDGFEYTLDQNYVYEFTDGLISIAFGVAFGAIVGIFVLLLAGHERKDHFTDTAYWMSGDGIRYKKKVGTEEIDDEDEIEVDAIEHSRIKNKHSYI